MVQAAFMHIVRTDGNNYVRHRSSASLFLEYLGLCMRLIMLELQRIGSEKVVTAIFFVGC